jgi:multidrug efflux pump subunit AcrA (membrane-fusion protein)
LLGRANYDAILVPENAINTDQDKKFVYIIDENNAIKRQYVSVGNLLENDLIVVSTGLTGNEKVVVNGIQRIQASGQEVTPNVVELEWKPINVLGKQASDQTTKTTNTYM